MKSLPQKTEKEIDDLLKKIKDKTGFTQEQIAGKIGYNRSYISQAKKTDSEKLYTALYSGFRDMLENITPEPAEDVAGTYNERTVFNLTESNRMLAESTKEMVYLLKKVALLDEIKTNLDKIPGSMTMLTDLLLQGQERVLDTLSGRFSELEKQIASAGALKDKKPSLNQKRS